MERTSMNDLICSLKAATGPDRGLDAEIAVVSGQFVEKHDQYWTDGWVSKARESPWVPAPYYTRDLHAVLPLVPILDGPKRGLWVGLDEVVGAHGTSGCTWHARIWGIDNDEIFSFQGYHNNISIALLIALLEMKESGS
jgi:hypothetical protein